MIDEEDSDGEAAKGFALRILNEAGATDQQRLVWAWQTALGREPSGKELNVARAFLVETRKRYQADAKAADKLLAVGMLATRCSRRHWLFRYAVSASSPTFPA